MSDTPDPGLSSLQDAICNLPRLQREIFIAHCQCRMSYGEIARRTGLSARRVERHVARAIYKLAKQMDGEKLSWWERWF